MDVSNKYVNKTVQKNIDDYEKYDWYVDWTLEKTTDEMIDYYCNSEDYRKKMATFKIYAIKNHLAILKQYKASVKIGIKKLKKRLE